MTSVHRDVLRWRFPPTWQTISEAAFQNSRQLVLLTIPESVKPHWKTMPFQGCTSLASITLGESVAHIGTAVPFEVAPLWRALLWVILWVTLGSMPFKAAPLWRALLWVILWVTLGTDAFQGCTSLASITLGESVTHIGDAAFSNAAPLWRALLWVTLWLTLDTVPFEVCTSFGEHYFGWFCDSTLGDHAFQGCTSLASITLGDSVSGHWGRCLFKAAPLWRASLWVSQWADMSDYFVGQFPWQSQSLKKRKRRRKKTAEWVSERADLLWPCGFGRHNQYSLRKK